MKLKCVTLLGLFFLLATAVQIVFADTGQRQGQTPSGAAMLEATVARLESIRDIRDVSPADRKRLLEEMEKTCHFAQAELKTHLKTCIGKILVCLNAISSCDLGDSSAQEAVGQRIDLECLSMADALPVDLEFRLVVHIGLGPAQSIDSKGQKTIGKQWQSLRNRLLEHRLHLWRRIADEIDPQWDPNDSPEMNIMPPGGGAAGMAPEAIADPKLRARYEMAIEANRKKGEAYNRQLDARSIRDRYLPQLKAPIGDAYTLEPVTEDDLDMLKAYLRIYVMDEKLRREFFEIAHAAAKNRRIKDSKSSDGDAGRN